MTDETLQKFRDGYNQGRFDTITSILEIIDDVVAPDDIEIIYQVWFYMASDEIKGRILEFKFEGEQK